MDSCNSGSLQSSSGGEEEYDSRATFSAAQINPNPLPPLAPFFDPFVSNYTQLNSFISHTKALNSPPIITSDGNNPFTTTSHPPPATVTPPNPAARNPKKRTRASRRAPTTVLTTDTTNFRAMVQEFTGIPSPPFISSSPFTRNNRLDLFASSLDTPSYLRRPFAQKLQSPVLPFLAGNNNTSLSATSQSSNIFSNVVDQSFFLGTSANIQANDHQKCTNLFGLGMGSRAVDDQVLASLGVASSSSASDHQFGLGNPHLNNVTASTTFEGGLANLISSSSNNASASSFNGEKGQESSGREGMVEKWMCSSSE